VAAARRLEYDAINGAVVRAGKETGLPTPVHEFCWTCLKVVDSVHSVCESQSLIAAAVTNGGDWR
jgi:ketopantoate reductase